jgi:hypothetical protein
MRSSHYFEPMSGLKKAFVSSKEKAIERAGTNFGRN